MYQKEDLSFPRDKKNVDRASETIKRKLTIKIPERRHW